MFSILIVRLFQLQIVKGQEYENNFILQTKREIVLSGAEEIFMIAMESHLLQISWLIRLHSKIKKLIIQIESDS